MDLMLDKALTSHIDFAYRFDDVADAAPTFLEVDGIASLKLVFVAFIAN